MLNALSIDLEEWFCVSNFESVIPRDTWDGLESRVEASTGTILELFERRRVRATFFVLGWVAERHPALIRAIADAGHEIASHGYAHRLVYDQTPEEFRADLARSIEVIRAACGRGCLGYRAPSFSLRRDATAAWEALESLGFRYDSSIFPVVHDRYGEPDAPRKPWVTERGIVEFPMSTVTLGGRNLPVAGGGYFRLYPLALTRWAVRRLNRANMPAVVYLHPWEFDPGHPRPAGVPRHVLARHRVGLGGVVRKLDTLLGEFPFGTMQDVLQANGFDLAASPSAAAH